MREIDAHRLAKMDSVTWLACENGVSFEPKTDGEHSKESAGSESAKMERKARTSKVRVLCSSRVSMGFDLEITEAG